MRRSPLSDGRRILASHLNDVVVLRAFRHCAAGRSQFTAGWSSFCSSQQARALMCPLTRRERNRSVSREPLNYSIRMCRSAGPLLHFDRGGVPSVGNSALRCCKYRGEGAQRVPWFGVEPRLRRSGVTQTDAGSAGNLLQAARHAGTKSTRTSKYFLIRRASCRDTSASAPVEVRPCQ